MARVNANLIFLVALLLLVAAACASESTESTESSTESSAPSLPGSCDDDPILCINELDRNAIDLEDMVLMHCLGPGMPDSHYSDGDPQGVRHCTVEEAIGLFELEGEVHVYSPGLCEGTCRVLWSPIRAAAERVGLPYACGCAGRMYNTYSRCRHCGVGRQCEEADGLWSLTHYRLPPGADADASEQKSPVETATDHFRPCTSLSRQSYEYVRDLVEHRALTCAVPASFLPNSNFTDDHWRTYQCLRLIPRQLVPDGSEDRVFELDVFEDEDYLGFEDDWERIRQQRIAEIQEVWERWQEDSSIRIPIDDWIESEYRDPRGILDRNVDAGVARLRELLDEMGLENVEESQ